MRYLTKSYAPFMRHTETRVCEYGIISFCGKEKTDNAILRIQNECKRNLGYSVRIAVVK